MTLLKLEAGELNVVDAPPLEEVTLDSWKSGARPQGAHAALVLPNDALREDYENAVGDFATVILDFPRFADGRAYTQASDLRMRCAYDGEIRARGDVLCDQVLFMARCGFDAFEIGAGNVAGFRRALKAYSAFYQATADDVIPVWRLRSRDSARRRAA